MTTRNPSSIPCSAATFFPTNIKWPSRASSSSVAFESCAIGFRGITRKWTGAWAEMSWKATHCGMHKKNLTSLQITGQKTYLIILVDKSARNFLPQNLSENGVLGCCVRRLGFGDFVGHDGVVRGRSRKFYLLFYYLRVTKSFCGPFVNTAESRMTAG